MRRKEKIFTVSGSSFLPPTTASASSHRKRKGRYQSIHLNTRATGYGWRLCWALPKQEKQCKVARKDHLPTQRLSEKTSHFWARDFTCWQMRGKPITCHSETQTKYVQLQRQTASESLEGRSQSRHLCYKPTRISLLCASNLFYGKFMWKVRKVSLEPG